LKGETLKAAAERKLKEEVGITDLNLNCVGIYEDFFDRNSFELDTLYHTVSVVFKAQLISSAQIKLDSQSDEWKYNPTLPERFTLKCSHFLKQS
jgi:ADP-ribose pyrophosphatase YjhB (NUDIX family)